MNNDKIKCCIRNFLPDTFNYNILDKYIKEGITGNKRLAEDEGLSLKENDAIIKLISPYVYNFTNYLNEKLQVKFDIGSLSLLVTSIDKIVAEGWHRDEEYGHPNRRTMVIPLTIPLINTRIAYDDNNCDRQNLNRRDYWTCGKYNMNRGSATYFDARLCHRGPNMLELTDANVRVMLGISLWGKRDDKIPYKDEYETVSNYNANQYIKGGTIIRKSLDKCTVTELKERANKRGIKITGLNKQEIINKLRNKI